MTLELAAVQTGQTFDRFFGETSFQVSISKANFTYDFIDLYNVTVPLY